MKMRDESETQSDGGRDVAKKKAVGVGPPFSPLVSRLDPISLSLGRSPAAARKCWNSPECPEDRNTNHATGGLPAP